MKGLNLTGYSRFFCKAYSCRTETCLGDTYCNDHAPVVVRGNNYVICSECGTSNILFYRGFYKCPDCGKNVKVKLVKVTPHVSSIS